VVPSKGLLAAAFTPMKPDAAVDFDRVGPLVDHFVNDGVAGIFALGSTGEGASLTANEKREVLKAFVEAADGRLPVLVQVGNNSLSEAAAMAEFAQEVGVAGISATPPSYFKPDTVEALVASMSQIAAAAPHLPFYYYHIPMLTGVTVDVAEFLAAAGDRIPNLAGLKFTARELNEFHGCLAVDPSRYTCFFGFDDMLLGALATGATVAIGATYNFSAPLFLRMMKAFDSGDLEQARRCQYQGLQMMNILFRHRIFPAAKAVMKLIDVPCGPVRLPHRALTAEETAALRRDLDEVGFFDWARA